ncbi:hypothetical protein CEXT_93081 [Caerostris extrusa]|uniref:Uncharacterized protein n=1 Tax=Caerostris extrusa TaxID=172846 RepID=A0AAV4QSY9_CAEEX|nr:hypothetical protein CEXT_93081 [Caerostris extrusa]
MQKAPPPQSSEHLQLQRTLMGSGRVTTRRAKCVSDDLAAAATGTSFNGATRLPVLKAVGLVVVLKKEFTEFNNESSRCLLSTTEPDIFNSSQVPWV